MVALKRPQRRVEGHRTLYETFEPEEARRLACRLEIHYTPKHGNWLTVGESPRRPLKRKIFDCIETFYNPVRRHSALGFHLWRSRNNSTITNLFLSAFSARLHLVAAAAPRIYSRPKHCTFLPFP